MSGGPHGTAVEEMIRARIQSSIDVKVALARELDVVIRIADALIEGFRGGH